MSWFVRTIIQWGLIYAAAVAAWNSRVTILAAALIGGLVFALVGLAMLRADARAGSRP